MNLDFIPQSYRRRGLWVAATLLLRALLNLVGLAVLLPVLVLVLDPASLRGNGPAARAFSLSGISTTEGFALAVCAAVVAVIVLKCLLNLALARTERRYIYDLYRTLSRRLYVAYHDRGLGFVKRTNSAVLARNVNVVCLQFAAGVLKPAAAIAAEAMLFVLLFGALALYTPLAAVLALAVFLPAMWLYYLMIRNRINRYGEQENRAQREKSRLVAETFRGYADIEINGAFPQMLRAFDRTMDEVVRTRLKEASVGMLPSAMTEVGLAVGMALMVALGLRSGADTRLLFGVFAIAALRLMPSVRGIMGAWTTIRYNRYSIGILREALGTAEPERTGTTDAARSAAATDTASETRIEPVSESESASEIRHLSGARNSDRTAGGRGCTRTSDSASEAVPDTDRTAAPASAQPIAPDSDSSTVSSKKVIPDTDRTAAPASAQPIAPDPARTTKSLSAQPDAPGPARIGTPVPAKTDASENTRPNRPAISETPSENRPGTDGQSRCAASATVLPSDASIHASATTASAKAVSDRSGDRDATEENILPFEREIAVRDLSFRFEDGGQELFRGLTLTIRKGERVGIRGVSGAGKTTLFNLLLGLYRPTGGEIAIDGIPLTADNRRAWQNRIGYVSQNLFLIDGTFAENVALGTTTEEIDRSRAEEALRIARMGDFIATLPRGIDTPIGECGCRLSGGQRQRIGIARALYRRADVLFFDEATSALDSRTEEEINRAVTSLASRRRELTVVVIAHRESSLGYCTRIITLA